MYEISNNIPQRTINMCFVFSRILFIVLVQGSICHHGDYYSDRIFSRN
ncbi:hypothetical protein BS78_10G226400 [Paspalum vaginatum]|nr:hypothetical protein BS78_10G226400 [Paspalum vaginatum]